MKRSQITLLIAFSLLIVGTIILGTFIVSSVGESARAIAGSTSYCIQIPGDGDYVEAKTVLDISPFRMRGSGGNHHAVLIVGSEYNPKLFHWSYWKGRFIEGVYGPPPIYCKPREHFLEAMPLSGKDPVAVHFYFVDRHFSVPRVYRPSVNWASRRALVFYATTPEFAPSPNSADHGSYVDVVFGRSPLLPSWLNKTNDQYLVEGAESEFGLQKQLVWYRNSSTGQKEKFSNTQYFLRAGNGDIATLILCNYGNCTQIFEQDGWSYYFHHTTETLPAWKSHQDKLTSLAHSFVVSQ